MITCSVTAGDSRRLLETVGPLLTIIAMSDPYLHESNSNAFGLLIIIIRSDAADGTGW